MALADTSHLAPGRKRGRVRNSDDHEARTWAPLDPKTVAVDIVVPCHNEAATLEDHVSLLHKYLDSHLPYKACITIADSGSTDDTWAIAQKLSHRWTRVRVVRELMPGRGLALRKAWTTSTADVVCYMDEDFATSLQNLPDLLKPLIEGRAAMSVGSRLLANSRTTRSIRREIISHIYAKIVWLALPVGVRDLQCGFKAMRCDAMREVLPDVQDNGWFFDTELIAKVRRRGWLVDEIPVVWKESATSSVRIFSTAKEDILGLDRVRAEFGYRVRLETLALGGLLAGTALLYLWHLTNSGYGNSFYASAVQAGTVSWKAFFYGSLDAANFITVDKPPVSLWVMSLCGRLLGFSSFSMLLPDALAGIGTVYLVYAGVRRWFSAPQAWVAGAVVALTPVAVLMFRFNNPDGILTFLMTASAYCLILALDKARLSWLICSGVLLGFAFNTKMLQGLIVLPVFALVYFMAAKPRWPVRLWHLVVAGVATGISSLWWPITVSMIPASQRPYIGSSGNNSIWSLIFGYNGLQRIFGGMGVGHHASGPGGGKLSGLVHGAASGFGGIGFGGVPSLLRLFNASFGAGVSWFLPLALVGMGLALWQRRHRPRTDLVRAAFALWGGWLILHYVIFSYMGGTIHPYYPVVMAPAIGALVGMGLPYLWRSYNAARGFLAWLLPVSVFLTGLVAFTFMTRDLEWNGWLSWVVLIVSGVAALVLSWHLLEPVGRRMRNAAAAAAVVACAVGPAGYSLATAAIGHTGSTPAAGPATAASGPGGNFGTANADPVLVQYLERHRDGATWLVAVDSAMQSAPIQLASDQPVMAIGGFMGSDQPLTLAKFKALVRAGRVRYFAATGGGPGGSGMAGAVGGGGPAFGGFGGGNGEITAWAENSGTKVDYGDTGATLYRLSE